MLTQTKINANIGGAFVLNWQYLQDWITQSNMSGVVIMDNYNKAIEIKNANPDMLVIHRDYVMDGVGDGEAWKKRSAKDLYNWYIKYHQDKRIIAHLFNEPITRNDAEIEDLLDKCMDLSDLLLENGYSVCVGNFAIGIWNQQHLERGLFDKFILWAYERTKQYGKRLLIGSHEYTAMLAPFGVGHWTGFKETDVKDFLNPSKYNQSNWLKPNEVVLDFVEYRDENGNPYMDYPHYWHILRTLWLIIRLRQITGDDTAYFYIYISEAVFDRMPDISLSERSFTFNGYYGHAYQQVENFYGSNGYPEIKGHNTLKDYYNAIYPQYTFEQALFEQYKWLENIYPDFVLGFAQFSWTFNSPWKWPYGHDISENYELHALITEHGNKLLMDKPTEQFTKFNLVEATGINADYVNVRSEPMLASNIVAQITKGERFFLSENTVKGINNTFDWYGITFTPDAKDVFYIANVFQFELVPEETELKKYLLSEIDKIQNQLSELTNRIELDMD